MRRVSKIGCILIGIITLSLIFVTYSFAISKSINLGPFKIRPSLDISVEYNSNYELKESDEEEDFIYHITPGLGISFGSDILRRQTKRLYFDTNYSVEYLKYPGGDDHFLHSIGGVLRYNISPITSIGISDTFRQAPSDIIGGVVDDDYDHNTATASLTHLFGRRLAASLGYTQENYDDDTGDEYADYETDKPFLNLSYTMSPKTKVKLNSNYTDKDFDDTEDKDYDGYDVNLGIERKVTSRSTLGLNAGYVERDYSDDTADTDDVTWGASLTTNLPRLSVLKVNYTYSIQDTYYSKSDLFELTSFTHERDTATSLDQLYKYIDTHHIGATLYYNLTGKNTLIFDAAYMQSDAPSSAGLGDTAHRTNDLDEEAYTFGVGLNRKFNRYITAGLKTSYGDRESNVRSDYDYWSASFVTKLSF